MENGHQIRMEELAEELRGESEEYDAFLEKFKPKRTTDDCFTPDNIYDAVADWVSEEYGVERGKMLRPFYPGGDYEHAEYPDGYVVVDNPPFSIVTKIVRFYIEHDVKFFLFAPGLTLLSGNTGCCAVCVDARIRYANGATIPTSFLTNLEKSLVRSAPKLQAAIDKANRENIQKHKKSVTQYEMPRELLTAARIQKLSKYGVDFKVKREEGFFTRALDMQRRMKKSVFGAGYIVSSAASERLFAAERAAAERKNLVRLELSERERRIVAQLDAGSAEQHSRL